NLIVGAVEPLALITIGQHGHLTVLLQANHASIAVLIDGQPSVLIESQTIRTGLSVLANIYARVTALCSIDRKLAVWRPTIDDVCIMIVERTVLRRFLRALNPIRPL